MDSTPPHTTIQGSPGIIVTQPQPNLNAVPTTPDMDVDIPANNFLVATPTTPPATTAPLVQSTPVKAGTATTFPFTTNQKFRNESYTRMGEEMKKYLIGPMPAQEFLDDFFPVKELSDLGSIPLFKPGCYKDSVTATRETAAYSYFVSCLDKFTYASSQVLFLSLGRYDSEIYSQPQSCGFICFH